jgi:hypothetical protein
MKFSKLTLCFGILAVAVASAASSYNVSLASSTMVGQTQLKPGQYKVEVEGDKAVFKSGKNTVAEAPATAQQNPQKYSDTTLLTSGGKLEEIHVGGTNVRIVLKDSASGSPAQ